MCTSPSLSYIQLTKKREAGGGGGKKEGREKEKNGLRTGSLSGLCEDQIRDGAAGRRGRGVCPSLNPQGHSTAPLGRRHHGGSPGSQGSSPDSATYWPTDPVQGALPPSAFVCPDLQDGDNGRHRALSVNNKYSVHVRPLLFSSLMAASTASECTAPWGGLNVLPWVRRRAQPWSGLRPA